MAPLNFSLVFIRLMIVTAKKKAVMTVIATAIT